MQGQRANKHTRKDTMHIISTGLHPVNSWILYFCFLLSVFFSNMLAFLDVNECAMPGAACFKPGSTALLDSISACQNSPGGYSCSCADGYRRKDGDLSERM